MGGISLTAIGIMSLIGSIIIISLAAFFIWAAVSIVHSMKNRSAALNVENRVEALEQKMSTVEDHINTR